MIINYQGGSRWIW